MIMLPSVSLLFLLIACWLLSLLLLPPIAADFANYYDLCTACYVLLPVCCLLPLIIVRLLLIYSCCLLMPLSFAGAYLNYCLLLLDSYCMNDDAACLLLPIDCMLVAIFMAAAASSCCGCCFCFLLQ